MANAKWSGKPAVNPRKNKQSHLVLTDSGNRFTATTVVKNPVKDTDNASVTFVGTVLKRWTKNRLEIRLKSTATALKKDDTTPTSGTLSITLTDTATATDLSVDPIPVDYTDDTDACE